MFPTPGLQKYYLLRNFVTPILNEISKNIDEGASLAILSGNHAIIIAKATSGRTVDVSLRSGILVPLHCTGVGKAVLAYLPPTEVDRIIEEEGLIPSTSKTIIEKNSLDNELVEIKHQGYAVDNEEWETGIRCVAVPVFKSDNAVFGAISVSGPTGRLTQDNDCKIAELISKGARKLSIKLGYKAEEIAESKIKFQKDTA
jgi:IclR family acetate operon transcriptional repressor